MANGTTSLLSLLNRVSIVYRVNSANSKMVASFVLDDSPFLGQKYHYSSLLVNINCVKLLKEQTIKDLPN